MKSPESVYDRRDALRSLLFAKDFDFARQRIDDAKAAGIDLVNFVDYDTAPVMRSLLEEFANKWRCPGFMFLLEQGARVANEDGQPQVYRGFPNIAFILAINGEVDMLHEVIRRAGSDLLCQPAENGRVALHEACYQTDLEMAALLLELRPECASWTDYQNYTPLALAQRKAEQPGLSPRQRKDVLAFCDEFRCLLAATHARAVLAEVPGVVPGSQP